MNVMRMWTYDQNEGNWPARYPPLPGPFGPALPRPAGSTSLPACCQQLTYGDLTAKGMAGGLAGEKVDAARQEVEKRIGRRAPTERNILPERR